MKRTISLILALALCTGLASPALAASFYTDTGSNDVSIYHGSPFFIVNSSNELWRFDFPNELGSSAKSEKVADGVLQVSSGLTDALVLKSDGKIWEYGYSNGTWSDTGINNAASITSELNCYITKNGDLMFKQGGEYVKIDSNVKTVATYGNVLYIKNDGSLYKYETKSGSKFLLNNVEKIYVDQSTYFAITEDNSLYAWGSTANGQTGVPRSASTFVESYLSMGGGSGMPSYYVTAPTLIMDNVERVIPDSLTTRVVTTDGRVLTWGGGDQIKNPDVIVPKQVSGDQWMAEPLAVYFTEYHMAYYIKRQVIQYADGTLVLRQPKQVTSGMTNDEATFPEHTFTVNMTLRGLGGGQPQPPVPEVPSVWAVDAVNAAVEMGIVPENLQSGYKTPATRAEFCALAVALYEYVTGEEIEGRVQFDDTDDVNVEKAAFIGVVNGIGGNKFGPGDKLNREQAATMLARLASAIGKPLAAEASTFVDSAKLSSWAVEAVGQMQATGIMTGVGENTFAPQDDYTREQCILTIMRLFDVVK